MSGTSEIIASPKSGDRQGTRSVSPCVISSRRTEAAPQCGPIVTPHYHGHIRRTCGARQSGQPALMNSAPSTRAAAPRVIVGEPIAPSMVPFLPHSSRNGRGTGVNSPIQRLTPQRPDQAISPDQGGKPAAPSAGFEPAHTAPEADALSPELRGREPRDYRRSERTRCAGHIVSVNTSSWQAGVPYRRARRGGRRARRSRRSGRWTASPSPPPSRHRRGRGRPSRRRSYGCRPTA